MTKVLPSDFIKGGALSGKPLTRPTFFVTSLSKSAAPAYMRNAAQPTLYSVDSLAKLALAFQENERAIKSKV